MENSGKQINDYKYISMDLYFSDETGEKLKSENRALYYSSNVPLERVVVEQLIKGPAGVGTSGYHTSGDEGAGSVGVGSDLLCESGRSV